MTKDSAEESPDFLGLPVLHPQKLRAELVPGGEKDLVAENDGTGGVHVAGSLPACGNLPVVGAGFRVEAVQRGDVNLPPGDASMRSCSGAA